MADPFDDRLRCELQQAVGSSADAHSVLGNLTPSMRRARRRHVRHQAMAATTGLLAIAAVVAGVGTYSPNHDRTTVVAAAPTGEANAHDESPTLSATANVVTSAPTTASTVDSSAAVTSSSTTSWPTTAPGPAPTTSAPTSPAESTSSTSGPSVSTSIPPTSDISSSTTEPTATTGGPTTGVPSNEQTVESVCGSMVVLIDAANISLVDTQPDPGFGTDIKSAGPEQVEVSFEGSEGHCELKAEVRNGQLWSDVDDD